MKNDVFTLHYGDCVDIMDTLIKASVKVNMIFADPPYFLSNNGTSVSAGKRVNVNKGSWDRSQGWDANLKFTQQWLTHAKDILTDNGTLWVSGTLHNIYVVGFTLQQMGFKILNDITWFKPNAPPHLSCRYFAHAHETILWAKKNQNSKHTFNYSQMKHWGAQGGSLDTFKNPEKQMRSVWQVPDDYETEGDDVSMLWSIPTTPKREKAFGKHPTQKPIELLKRIILSSTNEGDVILDPFVGSGTTGVVAQKHKRKFIGIENDRTFFNLAANRIYETVTKQ